MRITLLSGLLALVFLASGAAKLVGLPFELAAFERWGYPLWFMYLTGVIEVLGGLGLLLPRWAPLAALGLTGMMIGALATHALHGEWPMFMLAALILALNLLRALAGRDEVFALLRKLRR